MKVSCQLEERPETVAVGCTRPAGQVAEEVAEVVTVAAVDWVAEGVRWVETAGWAVGMVGWGSEEVGWVAEGWVEALEDSGLAEVDLEAEVRAVEMVASDWVVAKAVAATAAWDSAEAVEETGSAVAAMAVGWEVKDSVEAEEETGLAEVAAVAWAEVESCVWRRRTSILYRSKIQPCSCTELR